MSTTSLSSAYVPMVVRACEQGELGCNSNQTNVPGVATSGFEGQEGVQLVPLNLCRGLSCPEMGTSQRQTKL